MENLSGPAGEAILTGDPRRAFALARDLLEEPRMSHLARGLWGYSGRTGDGRQMTVQSTGSGGPAGVSSLVDLARAGVTRAVRMGTCDSVDGGPAAGALVVVSEAVCLDGAGGALAGGAGVVVEPDRNLTRGLEGIGEAVRIASTDLPVRIARELGVGGEPDGQGPVLRDLQTGALLAAATRLEVAIGAVLVVVEDAAGNRLTESEVERALTEAGPVVLEALGHNPIPQA